MKYMQALTLSVLAVLVAGSAAAMPITTRAGVCTYRVASSNGFLCPLDQGDQVCLTQTTATGPCEKTLRCFSSSTFCTVVIEPFGEPRPQCPAAAARPRGLNCGSLPSFSRITRTPTATRTATVPPFATPTSTPSATLIPSPTATDTPIVALPTFTATGTPTGTAAATATFTATATEAAATATASASPTDTVPALPTFTATGTPTGTAAASATATATATEVPPTPTFTATFTVTLTATLPPTTSTATETPTDTPTGTPTGTASATVTFTATQTGVPTGTAAAFARGRTMNRGWMEQLRQAFLNATR